MKRNTPLLAGLVLLAGLLMAAVSIRDYVLDHLKVGPGMSGTTTRQTNVVEIADVTGTNAFEVTTNTVPLGTNFVNTIQASNSYRLQRFALRSGTNRWFAVTNGFITASNPVTGKYQTNMIINGLIMEFRGESY